MSIARIKTWLAGQVLTASDLNNEFNNLTNNVLVEPFVATQQVDINGQLLLLDADGDTLLDGSTNNQVTMNIGGAADFRFTANTFTALSGSTVTIDQGALTVTDGQTSCTDTDTRTNTVITPLIVSSPTSGAAAAGIGTGILVKARSSDENPSDFGQIDFTASDIGVGTEDTYFQILLRVAGAALSAAYRFVATSAFRAIFTHANTADRTYTLPNRDTTVDAGDLYMGPSSIGSGSTRSHEGTVTISGNQALDGVHFYTNFTLNSGVTVTLDDESYYVAIYATDTITISGTIDAIGAGVIGVAGTTTVPGNLGNDGFSQPGGGGGGSNVSGQGGAGGASNAVTRRIAGGAGGGTSAAGTAGTSLSGDRLVLASGSLCSGGASGGSGNGTGGATGGASGRGGGSILLSAPIIILNNTATFNTSGDAGAQGGANSGGGGGGGAGNVYIITRSYTDNGATFTLTGGAGGASNGAGAGGGAGAAGVKQINLYA